MGTILGNPYEFNFAQVANAEFRSESSQTTLTGERIMLSSKAAACSSKLNLRQKRFRRDSPHALLTREP